MSQTCEHGIPVEIACGYCILFASNKALKVELDQAKANTENWRKDANRYRRALESIEANLVPAFADDPPSVQESIEIVKQALDH